MGRRRGPTRGPADVHGAAGHGQVTRRRGAGHRGRTDLLGSTFAIVSKWMGETEKNLAAAFDAAERTQAVLFLDEADALFGTRTEITDAHDRYANLETAYLLQRLDTFDGLLVLATNLRHNIDPAFIRRMDFVIEFRCPTWPPAATCGTSTSPTATDGDVDLEVAGPPVPDRRRRDPQRRPGAAFTAAPTASVHQHHLIAAVRREYAKAALPFPGEPPRRRDEH